MINDIDKLRLLYKQYDMLLASGEDVVADLRKEISNLELSYLKEQVFPQVAQFMASKICDLRCSIDSNLQFDGEHNINYSFCASGTMLLVKDSVDTHTVTKYPQQTIIQSTVAESSFDYGDNKSLNDDQWIKMLLSMRGTKVKGVVSPHKAIFILTIIDCIKKGYIQERRIFASNTLSNCFIRIWNKYVPMEWPFTANVFQPYIHMSSEPFYSLVYAEGVKDFDINQNWNRSLVIKYVEYAYFDDHLFELFHKQEFTDRLSKLLIDKFFYQEISNKRFVKKEFPPESSNTDAFAGYKKYLSTLISNIGRPYSASSINVYATALRSKYMHAKVSKFTHTVENLEAISDLSIIDRILDEVRYEAEHNMVNKTTYLALKMFRDYRRLNPIASISID